MSEMKTSEILNLAADQIESRGWIQAEGWNDDATSPLCLEGGIQAAMGFANSDGGFNKMKQCPAYSAVRDYLDLRGSLWGWNDRSDRTKEEVIEVLRAAALVEASKENADFLTDREVEEHLTTAKEEALELEEVSA